MNTIGIRELRTNLAESIAAAQAGHAITITSHGRPVAELTPVGACIVGIDALVASGALRPPNRRGRWQPPAPISILVGTRIDQALRDIRG